MWYAFDGLDAPGRLGLTGRRLEAPAYRLGDAVKCGGGAGTP